MGRKLAPGVLLVVLTPVLLGGCAVGLPGSSTPTPTSTPTVVPTATPIPSASAAISAVQTMVCWGAAPASNITGCPTHPTGTSGPCYQVTPQWTPPACPVTSKLEARLRQNPTSGRGGGADPICRCQNVPTDLTFTPLLRTPTRDVIEVVWNFGGPSTAHSSSNPAIDYVVVNRGGTWLVDDSYCSGYPTTSIYNSPVGPCG
ncbi:MAG TPA: hypothetical protein VFB34_10695 [Chloroflexota bacterium]|nr:hypothetical protein [Chloroflexota bacterium]